MSWKFSPLCLDHTFLLWYMMFCSLTGVGALKGWCQSWWGCEFWGRPPQLLFKPRHPFSSPVGQDSRHGSLHRLCRAAPSRASAFKGLSCPTCTPTPFSDQHSWCSHHAEPLMGPSAGSSAPYSTQVPWSLLRFLTLWTIKLTFLRASCEN